MSILTSEKCTACRRDSPRVTEEEMSALKPLVPEWKLVEREGIQRLERVFPFANFAEALAFTNRVGAVAEEEGHHPAILTEWGRVTVTLWTHKIRALHRNDFIVASKLDSQGVDESAARGLGDSLDEEFVHFREGRPLCRPIFLPVTGARND